MQHYDPGLVGRRLAAARSAKALSLESVAHETGLLESHLLALETGGVVLYADDLVLLCRLYGISLDSLVAPGISGPEGG